jgi:hypothetical protein
MLASMTSWVRQRGSDVAYYFGFGSRPADPDASLVPYFVKAFVIVGGAYLVRGLIGVEEGRDGFLVMLGLVVLFALVFRVARAHGERLREGRPPDPPR